LACEFVTLRERERERERESSSVANGAEEDDGIYRKMTHQNSVLSNLGKRNAVNRFLLFFFFFFLTEISSQPIQNSIKYL
jgi:hypothetical protein